MKTICIKHNDDAVLDYLFCEINKLNIKELFFSRNEFKNYKNIIIHYRGEYEYNFLNTISDIIAKCIEIFFEKNILEKIIDENYFYFEDFEKEIILRIGEKVIEFQESEIKYKNEILKNMTYEYFLENKYMILDGFVIFRIKEYCEILNYVIDMAVSNFVINFR